MNAASPNAREALLRLPQVESLVGLKRSSIYRRIAAGDFPKPISLGGRAVAFPASQVQQWIADRIAGAAQGGAK
jgi:prophage regulatory protein